MKEEKRLAALWKLAVLFFILMSATILVMPFAVNREEQGQIFVVLIGAVFWISTLAGGVLVFLANGERERLLKTLKKRKECTDRQLPGVVCFFSNTVAKAADVICAISLLAGILIYFSNFRNTYLAYVALFLVVLSFNMHCFLNGRIYKLLKYNEEEENKNE